MSESQNSPACTKSVSLHNAEVGHYERRGTRFTDDGQIISTKHTNKTRFTNDGQTVCKQSMDLDVDTVESLWINYQLKVDLLKNKLLKKKRKKRAGLCWGSALVRARFT